MWSNTSHCTPDLFGIYYQAGLSSCLFNRMLLLPFEQTQVDSAIKDILWADARVVFILTEKGMVYKSEDGGKTVEALFKDTVFERVTVSKDKKHFVFMARNGLSQWTNDKGQTFKSFDKKLKVVKVHPSEPTWMLGDAMSPGCRSSPVSDCFKSLWLTTDQGSTWTKIIDYVVQWDWSVPRSFPHKKLIYASVHSEKRGNQRFDQWDKNVNLYLSNDFFATQTMIVPHGNRFTFGEHSFMFVAAVDPSDEDQVRLWINRSNETKPTFIPAVLPVDLTEHSYTILDTSEQSVFIHVNHKTFSQKASAGNLYQSDWSGVTYSLSLENNHRSETGECDFAKVEGLEGIYIANFVINADLDKDGGDTHTEDQSVPQQDAGKKRAKPAKVASVITFDKGGKWHYLAAPEYDADGKKTNCKEPCHLHLHGITDTYGPFYSTATATGLILATGNLGRYLTSVYANVYLSRDAGLTWYEIAKGSHTYEFGDHGGLIVMASDRIETKTAWYTWDHGHSWNEVVLSDTPFLVSNIIIEPKASSQEFIVYGVRSDGTGVVVYLDFNTLMTRDCVGEDAPDTELSDYETWTPNDGRKEGKCLLGRTMTYTRRKYERACFNKDEYERSQLIDHCKCNIEDFQCEYGYSRQGGSDECTLDATPPRHPDPSTLLPCNDFKRITKGYRRVPGNTCTGGDAWDALLEACPHRSASWGKSLLLVFFVIAVLYGCTVAFSKYPLLEMIPLPEKVYTFLKSKLTRTGAQGYSVVGTQESDFNVKLDDDDARDEDNYFDESGPYKDDESKPAKASSSSGASYDFGPLSAGDKKAKNVPALRPPSSQ
jgi:hypothetical protein